MNILRKLSYDEHKKLVDTVKGICEPTVFFKNVNVYNINTGLVEKRNVFIQGKRIAYIGLEEPKYTEKTEIIELNDNQILVPGYIEPHAHPNQIYNPVMYGKYLTSMGTTVSINDNLTIFANLSKEEIRDFLSLLEQTNAHMWLWMAYFEGDMQYYNDYLRDWAKNDFVVQGGEFTYWSQLKSGNENVTEQLYCLREELNKRIEGHLPGASENTLNLLAAAGITADHESLDSSDVIKRLNLGYNAAIRYSSIRRDLPQIIDELHRYPNINMSKLMFTNDGASAHFMEESVQCKMIRLAAEHGISIHDAYRMATINVATYYRLDHLLGAIAPGRLAHINIVEELCNPEPTSVMFDGVWKKKNGICTYSENEKMQSFFSMKRNRCFLQSIDGNTNIGIRLINDVITTPYHFEIDSQLQDGECFITYISRRTSFVINTRIIGFSQTIKAIASSYSASQDYIIIGRDKEAMIELFGEMMAYGDGIYAHFAGDEKARIELKIGGIMSEKSIPELDRELSRLVKKIKESGYEFNDPTYTLLFLTALHLPAVRFTENGIMEIRTKKILE